MMGTKQAMAEITCPIANQIPAKTNHTTLPIVPKAPVPISSVCVSSFRLIASLPKGKKENCPMTKNAFPPPIAPIGFGSALAGVILLHLLDPLVRSEEGVLRHVG